MALSRANTCPNTSSQSAGWIALVISSTGSRRSLRSSTSASAQVSRRNAVTGDSSTKAPGCTADPRGIYVTSSVFNRTSREMNEDVVQISIGTDSCLERCRRAYCDRPATMHNGNGLAQVVRFLHIMGCHQDRGSEL